MYSDYIKIRDEVRRWCSLDAWMHPFAVTLTLRQIKVTSDLASVRLTPETASRNVRHFLNILNKRVYGSAAQRYGKRIRVLAVAEGGASKRLHYHLMLDCPRVDLVDEFPMIVKDAWAKTDWGYHQIDVRPCDSGWLTYMTKFRDKPDFASSFDWEVSHIPD
ncbi:hypothetical protein EH30_12930 [Erythrobacter sp. JL475]|nr:hypothetical protein EH30_12930 [Erythrobacter sp. JL475]